MEVLIRCVGVGQQFGAWICLFRSPGIPAGVKGEYPARGKHRDAEIWGRKGQRVVREVGAVGSR